MLGIQCHPLVYICIVLYGLVKYVSFLSFWLLCFFHVSTATVQCKMASNTTDEDINLLSSSDDSIALSTSPTNNQDNLASEVAQTTQSRKSPFRSIGSSRLVLILVWGFLINCSLRLILYRLQYPHLKLEKSKDENSYSPWLTHGNDVVFNITFAISCPIAGLIAEVWVGRYRTISYTLRILWLLSIAGSVLSLCQYCLPHADKVIYNIQLYLVVVPGYVLKAAFVANAIPFGMDQITDGSNSNVCAYIVWFVWACFGSSYSIPSMLGPVLYKCSHLPDRLVSLTISILPVVLLSIGLILDFFLKHKLVQEPVSVNPVSLIFRVLKYAAKHRFPEQRSALTYWENKLPTRLDNGKSKYGGPFTTEQVEDVKTFWRVLVIILIISLFNLPLAPQLESTTSLESKFGSFKTRCAEAASSSAYTPYAFITYSIPLYELLIYPCLRKSGPSILQSAGIGAAVTISSSVYGMMAETTRQVISNYTVKCMFIEKQPSSFHGIDHFIVGIPLKFLLGFTLIILYVSTLEFICAQAPYNMKGLLIGISFMLQTFFSVLGTITYIIWSHRLIPILDTPTCGTWFYLTILVIAVLLSILLSWLVRWYKQRERDEILSTRMQVEDIYYKYDKKERRRYAAKIIPYQI